MQRRATWAQDTVRMATAGARGAAESARLVFETVTGLGASSGSEGKLPALPGSSGQLPGLAV